MTNFRAETRAWLDELSGCHPAPSFRRTIRTPARLVALAKAKANETLYLCSNERVWMQGV